MNDGRHAPISRLVNVGFALSGSFMLYAELWGAWDFGLVRAMEQFYVNRRWSSGPICSWTRD